MSQRRRSWENNAQSALAVRRHSARFALAERLGGRIARPDRGRTPRREASVGVDLPTSWWRATPTLRQTLLSPSAATTPRGRVSPYVERRSTGPDCGPPSTRGPIVDLIEPDRFALESLPHGVVAGDAWRVIVTARFRGPLGAVPETVVQTGETHLSLRKRTDASIYPVVAKPTHNTDAPAPPCAPRCGRRSTRRRRRRNWGAEERRWRQRDRPA